MGRLTCFEDLLGNVVLDVNLNSQEDELTFTLQDGRRCMLHHTQDCCENVFVENIAGNLDDIIGSPLLLAEEVSDEASEKESGADYEYESGTWTFYKLATNKGAVTIRWLGTSNGYYSEAVDFKSLPTKR